jgi:hypothetical protein
VEGGTSGILKIGEENIGGVMYSGDRGATETILNATGEDIALSSLRDLVKD